MKRVMQQIKYLYQMAGVTMLIFSIAMIGFPLMFAGIGYLVTEAGDTAFLTLDFYYIFYLWMSIIGILLSTKFFKIAMQVRVDRVPYLIAQTIVGTCMAVGLGICFYISGVIVQQLGEYIPRLKGMELIGSSDLGVILFSNIILVTLGLLLGALGNKVSDKLAIGTGIALIVLFCFSQTGDNRNFELIMNYVTAEPLLGLGSIVISMVGMTWAMLTCPLQKEGKTYGKKGDLCERN